MKTFVLSILFCLIGQFTIAQTSIVGSVVDEKGESLPGANIYFEHTTIGTISSLDGKFELNTELTGFHGLVIDFVGYQSFKQEIDLLGNKIIIQANLKPKFNQLKAVTITAGVFEASDKKKAVALKPLDIVTTAGALGDVSAALQTLPGTTTVGESGRLFVRGGDDTETQTYIDGIQVPVPYSSSGPNLSVRGRFNPFIFSGTVFSTGGYSAEYGQALSSVLLLNTKELPIENKTDLALMTVGGSAATTQIWNRGAVTATFDYINLTPYTEITSQNTDWLNAPEQLGGKVSLRQKTGKTGMLKLYGSIDQSKFKLNTTDLDSENGTSEFGLQNKNVFVNSNWRSILNETWSVKTGMSFTNNRDDIRTIDFDVLEELKAGHAKVVLENATSDRVSLKFGSEAFVSEMTQDVVSGDIDVEQKFQDHRFAGFSESEIYLSTKLAARIGGRIEYSELTESTTISPRFSTAYKLTEHGQVSLAYGQFYQQAPKEVLFRTDEIKEQRSDHYILNYQTNYNKRLLRTELYYKKYDNLITYTTDFSKAENNGSGYAYGFDIFYKDLKTIKNAQFWISYSYLNTERKFRNYPVQAIPTFASKHSTSVVYKHWIGEWKSMLSGSLRYSTPRRFNDPNMDQLNGAKTKPYRTMDLSWSYLPKQHLIFYAAVSNVLGFQNEFGQQFASEPNKEGVFISAPVLPSSDQFFFLGCFITFTKKGEANQLDTLN